MTQTSCSSSGIGRNPNRNGNCDANTMIGVIISSEISKASLSGSGEKFD